MHFFNKKKKKKVAANYALKHEYDLIPTREMYAHGIINLIGSLFGIFPAGGVFTHAPLADQAGAKTLVFNWICAAVVISVMILISGCPNLLYWLPRSVLAGIVWNACVGMFPYEKIKEIFSIDTKDSYIVAVTLLCTTLWGIFEGIEVGFALSIVFLVQRSSKPHCAIVGRIAHTTMYGSITSWPNAITTPGIVVFRFDGALYFGNVNYFKRAIQVVVERHRRSAKQLYFLILDCSAINDMDSSGVLALDNAHKHLDQNNVALILTDVKYPVMKLIKRSHLLKLIGIDRIFHNVFQAHMYILARLKFINGENLLEDKLYDYIDEKGFNRIQLKKYLIFSMCNFDNTFF
ncbi:sulfate transporter [Reticulomyxa filosa]|uniref:Sulfate transporter n=1 Tax=Reticulomyxa filosa TaxID=46433 RepID=X6NXG5_RETFI|nr:sulfate transporter [Reticulomyxa filosa]|eukprot:ETO30696.1 sulfate transporter [Reticulomyxa filosa]